jgi:hypothetical protein
MSQKDADNYFLANFDPELSYDDAIGDVAAQWPCDWGIYWGLESDQAPRYLGAELWADVLNLDRQAHRLVAAASKLSRRKLPEDKRTLPAWLTSQSDLERKQFDELAEFLREQLSEDDLAAEKWQEILGVIEGETPAERRERFFHVSVQIHAYQRFGYSPRALADRLLILLEFLVSTKVERAQAYLQRVANCFVLDLRPELGIMSRAVMEATLQSLDMESLVEKVCKARGKRHPSLIDWIDAASQSGVIDEDGRLAAEIVRKAGDDVVHVSHELMPEPTMVLKNLVFVLTQVERALRGSP